MTISVIQITAFQKIKHMHEVYFTIIKDIKLQFKNSAKRLLCGKKDVFTYLAG